MRIEVPYAIFRYKGKWVFEKHPHAYYFWMRPETNSLPKYLLYRGLSNILGWVCTRLNGCYHDPYLSWNTEICIRNRWQNPCGWFSNLFWKRELEKAHSTTGVEPDESVMLKIDSWMSEEDG